jgi:hypothetical protein
LVATTRASSARVRTSTRTSSPNREAIPASISPRSFATSRRPLLKMTLPLQVGEHVAVTQRPNQLPEVRHGNPLVTADVDPAQQRDIGHRDDGARSMKTI